MIHYIEYYSKKYWYLLILILVAIIAAFIFLFNQTELISVFSPFSNKVKFEPKSFTEEEFKDDTMLSDLKILKPYLGDPTALYIPPSLTEYDDIDEFKEEQQKDPNIIYMKKIDWSNGSLNNREYKDLTSLIEYHLNKTQSTTVIATVPSSDELLNTEKKVLVYVDDKGVLILPLHVEEIDEENKKAKSYVYDFKLSYDMDGKVNIR